MFRSMVATHEEADDLTQETFLKAYRRIHQFRHESTLYTWLYRIAVNTGINYIRRSKFGQMLTLDNLRQSAPTDDPELSPDLRQIIRKMIARLSSRQQIIVILRAYQELSFREIARILGITENAAKVNYAHALSNLRDRFNKMGVTYENL